MKQYEAAPNRKNETEFWNFVNVCAVFLAFISLYTTAEGMNRFFFRNDRIHGYLISLAVQGILLSLNLRLPRYLKGKALPAKCCAIGLYLFTVLWSSGFSYIFMSNVIYEDTWMKDAQIEISNLYQKERQELAGQVGVAMENAMGKVLADVTAFKARAARSDSTASGAGAAVDYESCLSLFSEDAQMLQIIYAFREGKDVSGKMQVITEREGALTEELKTITEEAGQADQRLSELDDQRTALIDRRARVPAGSDAHNSYSESIDEKTAAIEALRQEKAGYEEEKKLTEKKLGAVKSLYSLGQMTQNSAAGRTDQDFALILSELGGTQPDINRITELADGIYAVLTEGTSSEEDMAEYGQLLEEYLLLRADLSDAAKISSVIAWLEKEDSTARDMEQLVKADGREEDLTAWREGWNQALSNLKQQILLIPSQADDGYGYGQTWAREGAQEDAGKKQREMLLASITQMQRNYLLELNDVEKAGNYLFGNYPSMAWFSLLFAVYLDTAPMLLSVFKYCSGKKQGETEGRKKDNLYLKAALGAGCTAFLILNSLLLLKVF